MSSPLSTSRYGITPTWTSEIEKSICIYYKTTLSSYASIWGSITKKDGYHLFIFSSPCQNLSNIDKREGLTGSQLSFSYQMLRVIDDKSCATKSSYPVIAV
ncbi:DNA cytosine methyltransferase [Bacillus chungangensis]|uniref:DNA cytosine methyltransferase n=1 Tax=Bacillus chungangensis TaxID=587633 RepID=UPI0035218933